jgi:DNA-binding NtrC family response regulator
MSEPHPGPDGARSRVLVVDDEQDIIDILREHLSKTFDVDTATDGRTALSAVRANPPDVMFLDIHMPGVNGVDVLKSVKELDPTIAVLMVTANTDNTLAAEALERGAFSYVPKPFDLRYLDHLVAAALSQRRRRRR